VSHDHLKVIFLLQSHMVYARKHKNHNEESVNELLTYEQTLRRK
jgi:hypothetical protein